MVCSSCRVTTRGFSRSRSLSSGLPVSSTAASETRTSMSISVSARDSSSRLALSWTRSTTMRPPARPRAFWETSRCRSAGQAFSVEHRTAQPLGPMEFPLSDRKLSSRALRPRRALQRSSMPASPMRFCERSRSARQGTDALKTCAKICMSSSLSREEKTSGWLPGALIEKVDSPLASDSRSERFTSRFGLRATSVLAWM
mmetsp:Transcript_63099/g.137114  ORF Transcript_63099/g.137114 Transcript_63099/m.137114 type:complete len:200 (+) Transcript_63099:693-1292(+)